MHVDVSVSQGVYRGHRTKNKRSQFSPSNMCILGMELKSLDLTEITLIYWAILLAHTSKK